MESPYSQASIFSKLFFKWPNSIIQLAKTKDELQLHDIPPVPLEYNVFNLHEEFRQLWHYEKKKEKPNLAEIILRICWRKNAWITFIVFAESIARIYQAVALGKFIGFLLNDNTSNNTSVYDNGYFISFLITLCGIIITFAHHQFFFYAWGLGLQVRLILTSTIYAKASRLHLRSLNSLPSGYGHIVNLCSQDVEAFQLAGTFLHFVYQPVVESLGVLFVGIWTIGVSFLAGFAFILLLLPLQAFFSHQLSYSRKNTSKHTDERIKLINQAITGIRLLKINGWELVFVAMIEKIRSLEIKALLRTNTLRAVNESIFFITPVLVGFFTFMTYSQTGGVLTVQKVLTVLTLFNISQMSMTKFFPFAVQYLSEARVGVRRIQHLLLLDESEALTTMALENSLVLAAQATSPPKAASSDESSNIVVQFENFNASWNYDPRNNDNSQLVDPVTTLRQVKLSNEDLKVNKINAELDDVNHVELEDIVDPAVESTPSSTTTGSATNPNMTLSNINLSVAQGELILVVGAVGASKTSLLLAVLRELQSLPGTAGGRVTHNQEILAGGGNKISGNESWSRIAYCAQEPWILSTSVKDNVLFGRPYDALKFQEVLTACAMVHDMELLPHRENTVVGSRGINLSGGQKARLALARCLYSDTELYLLDDPLSAVDAKVSNILFHQAICEYLAGKTRILVTHQIQFLSSPHVSRVVVMVKGVIVFCGKFSDLQQSCYSSEYADGFYGSSSDADNEKANIDGTKNNDDNTSSGNTCCTDNPDANKIIEQQRALVAKSDIRKHSSIVEHNASSNHKSSNKSNINNLTDNQSSSNPSKPMKNHSAHSDVVFPSILRNASMEFDINGIKNKNKDAFYNSVKGDYASKDAEGTVKMTDEIAADNVIMTNDVADEKSKGAKQDSDEQEQQEKAVMQGITVAEDREIGVVKLSTFTKYFQSMGGGPTVLLIMLLLMLGQVLAVLANIWLAQWSRMSSQDQQDDYVMHIYVVLVLLALAGSFLRSLVFFHFSIIAAESIHNSMLLCILRAPVLFFDSNPHGRILNRFSKDIGVIDDQLPSTVYDFFQCALMVCAAVVVVVIGTPYILIAILPLCYYFILLRGYFIKPSRDIKRIEGVSRSPIFTHLSETIDGLVTIRALGQLQAFITKFNEYINKNASVYFAFVAVSRWLGFRLDTIVVVLLLVSTFGATAAKEYDAGIQPVILAVGVMYILQLSGLFQWAVRQSAEVENMMVSVERVSAYTQVPSEPALHTDSKDMDRSHHVDKDEGYYKQDQALRKLHQTQWPTKGEIVMKNLTCSYRHDLPPIVRNLSLHIEGGERIGVVGRTGAGKSTLISAILRLVDITGGCITIDGVDITSVGLHDLRPKISVIPQVPFLFSGTIRKNLDTLDQYSDLQIWNAIDAVGLRPVIDQLSGRKQHQQSRIKKLKRDESKVTLPRNESKVSLSSQQSQQLVEAKSSKSVHQFEPPLTRSPQQMREDEGLQGMCEENGSNFSVGERQLLCLARAILQHNSILILDEATSNIDMETDSKIQATIRREFPYATVIMIAHRLQTVIDCDKIVVMKNGMIVEVGHPYELLTKHLNNDDETDETNPTEFQTAINQNSEIKKNIQVTTTIKDREHIRDSFAHMVKETGENMSKHLFLQSSQSFRLKHSASSNRIDNCRISGLNETTVSQPSNKTSQSQE